MIYLGNAATTKISACALAAMNNAQEEYFANPSSLHPLGQKAAAALFGARREAARLIGASPREITFVSGGTESDAQALLTGAMLGKAQGKTRILSAKIEHHAVLNTLEKLEREGFIVELLDADERGLIDPEKVRAALTDDTCLVNIMTANNETGTVQPVSEIGRICREKGVLFHTDAVQALGHMPIDVNEIGCDLLSASAHKFHGPRGCGLLYARAGIKPVRLFEGGPQERENRPGTENLPGILGMTAALGEAVKNMEENTAAMVRLRDLLTEKLLAIPGACLNGDREKRLPGHVNVRFDEVDAETALILLGEKGICASAGSACTAGSMEKSHVLLSMGLTPKQAGESLRFSLSEETTQEDILAAADAMAQIAETIRKRKDK